MLLPYLGILMLSCVFIRYASILLYELVLCALRLDAVFQGKAAKIQTAKDAFDAMGIDEDTLHMMTEADFTKQNVAIAIARQLSVAITAIKQK
jgi:hypothetical protein